MARGEYTRTTAAMADLAANVAKSKKVAEAGQRKTRIFKDINEVGGIATNAAAAAAQAQADADAAMEEALNKGSVADDGVPPNAPENVTTEAWPRAIAVGWDNPDTLHPTDYVDFTRVTITDTVTLTERTDEFDPATTGFFRDTATLNEHEVEVVHVDRWGRVSPPTAGTNVTPLPSATDRITAETAIIAGQTSNLLNDPGLAALTDPAKLANGIVTSAKTATTQDPNLLLFNEAEFSGTPDGNLAGAQLGNGQTLIVITSPDGRKRLQQDRAGGSTETYALPFPVYRQRTNGDVGEYFFSADAFNPTGATINVVLSAQYATDSAGTGAATVHGSAFAIPPGATVRVHVKFTLPAGNTYLRLYPNITSATGTINWDRFMLQTSSSKAEPGAYKPPGLSTGVVSAELLSAWTVAAGRAIIATATINTALIADLAVTNAQIDNLTVTSGKIADLTIINAKIADATIQSAKIASLVADKITTGTLAAATITLSSTGLIRAGSSMQLDSGGITMLQVGDYDTKAASGTYKISGRLNSFTGTEFGALMYYANTSPGTDGYYRGAILRADGAGTGSSALKGAIVLHATQAGTINQWGARIELLSSQSTLSSAWGDCNIYADVQAQRDVFAVRNMQAGGAISANSFTPQSILNSTSLANGSSLTVTHNLGSASPANIEAYLYNAVSTSNPDGVHPLPIPSGNSYIWDVLSNSFKIWNGTGGSRSYVAEVMR